MSVQAPSSGLALRGVLKRMPDFELRADFQIAPGERAGLSARSGSGKTTLLRIIAGLEAGTQGQVWLDGKDLSRTPPERRDIGFIFQEAALFPALSVLENAAYGLKLRGFKRPERETLAAQWLNQVGLGARGGDRPQVLSGGERQKLAWVRALIWKPRLLLLDEPFSALDLEQRRRLQKDLTEMHRLCPVPLLFVTHDPTDLDAIATTRVVLEESGEGRQRRFFRPVSRL